MKLEEVREKLRAIPEVTHVYADGHNPGHSNVIIEAREEWTFDMLSRVADLLGVRNIDLREVETDIIPVGSLIERNMDGCSTCGHGDSIIVRGVLT